MTDDHPVEWTGVAADGWVRIGRSGQAVVIEWDGIGQLRAQAGQRTTFRPAAGVDGELLQRFRATDLLACTRYLQGRCSLHGSAVSWRGGAVVLTGDSGAGKSTTAMALVRDSGAAFLADDVVPIDWDGAVPVAVPVDDKHWLTAETCRWLGLSCPNGHKGGLAPRERAMRPVPVRFIVQLVFEDGATLPTLLPVHGHSRFVALSSVHICYPLGGEAPARDLETRARLASDVQLLQLRRPRRLDAIVAAADLLTSYAQEHSS